ncbi:hypothetical protein Tco_1411711 [Tanacetum coccineum]
MPSAILSPDSSASYFASMFEASNSKRRAYVNSIPSRFVSIRPASYAPSLDELYVNNFYISTVASASSSDGLILLAGTLARKSNLPYRLVGKDCNGMGLKLSP